jgi:hypothetical protein
VPAKLFIEYSLCAKAEKYATGEQVHKLANLLCPYLVLPDIDDSSVLEFEEAEKKLRAFVIDTMLSQIDLLKDQIFTPCSELSENSCLTGSSPSKCPA